MKAVSAAIDVDEPVSQKILKRAVARGRLQEKRQVLAIAVQYLPALELLLITLEDQSAVALPVQRYPELNSLSHAERMRLRLGLGGIAICLDENDLHISIVGLVAASESLMRLAVAVAASRNGSRSSTVKTNTSRENGMKGGRPRKLAGG
ncbi:DUF2442 domain-containing protein [Duganella aceris]|uniref:DUF2442 domain-containing protein n=1 Tax=Duganella aceris TaxID=2703883 RepID=A0ABX0FNR0_9BURK|nr:DUF2442 domain-containing protein [Duganella aceris]NGZ86260.1 DUF2442 domain-containing protein [Duganella aceris]